jgi:ThiF family protein
MRTTLVIPGHIADRISDLATWEVETGGVLLARPAWTDNHDLRLLVRELHEVPEEAYERREAQQLLIRSEGYVPTLAIAEELACVPIWFHTHPGHGSSPAPSRHDRDVDRALSDVFRYRANSEFYGALIVAAAESDGITFSGILDDGQTVTSIDRLWVVGPRLALYEGESTKGEVVSDLYDRNIRAFGGAIQHVLADLRVAVVGCGGTGSAVAEQLVRLGVRDMLLIDPDVLSASNVTRVYGSRLKDVGRPKVDVLGDHLQDIMCSISVERLQSTITMEGAARGLLGTDVVFGCTDDNAGRMIISRFSTYFLTPVIDCGVLLSSDAGNRLDGIHGRVTVLYPGQACLICRGRVAEGYAPALPGVEPAVITYTTMVGAAAVAELIERLTHYGIEPVPSEVLLRLHDREVSTNNQEPSHLHYCDPTAGKLGLGITYPFLEQTW